MNLRSILPCLALAASTAAPAAVTLTDLGTAVPVATTTGHLGTLDNRYSFDGPSDSHGQSFTATAGGTLAYLDLAYNAGGRGSFQVFIDANYGGGGGTEIIADATTAAAAFTINIGDFITDPNGLSGNSTDTNSGPGYWMRLDFTAENVAITANQQAAWFIRAVSELSSDSGFIFAPRYHLNDVAGETDEYLGGSAVSGSGFSPAGSGHDFGFAVTVVPEPGSTVLASLAAGLTLLRRRRK